MEEFFLSSLLARHELNVVNQQHVDRSILLTKALRLVVANRIDEIVHESLGRDVAEFEMLIARSDCVSARMHQVRLAESDTAVQVKRVVGASRRFSYRKRSSVRELITRSNNETVVSVF